MLILGVAALLAIFVVVFALVLALLVEEAWLVFCGVLLLTLLLGEAAVGVDNSLLIGELFELLTKPQLSSFLGVSSSGLMVILAPSIASNL